MDDEIGIAADRRGEVRVVRNRQREVPDVLLGVKRALHRAQDDVGQEAFLRRPFDRLQHALQLAGTHVFEIAAQRELEFLEDLAKVLQLLRVGLLVNAEDAGLIGEDELRGDDFVRGEHELFDDAMRDVALGRLDGIDHARRHRG